MSGRPQSSPRFSPARASALTVLCKVEDERAYANLALNQELRGAGLSQQDAAFTTELVSGTLREQLLYDEVLTVASGRPIESLDVITRNILRLSAHQLLTMKSKAYAVVHEAVELQKAMGQRGGAGLVNAVLRRVSERSKDQWIHDLTGSPASPERDLSLQFSHPQWIVRALREALHAEGRAHELRELLEADNVPPRVNLVMLHNGTSALSSEGSEQLPDSVSISGPSPLGAILTQGSPAALTRSNKSARGQVLRVQDQGSQLAALAMSRGVRAPLSEHEEWLDLCAGPGGKTALLAAEASAARASLRAVEISEHRVNLVREALAQVNLPVNVVVADGTTPTAFAGHNFDRILVDAPCTGLGALRRRPDARLKKQPSDVGDLVTVQRKLLDAAASHLKPGGLLTYVTCSPLLAETRMQVDTLLAGHPELVELDAREVIQRIAREPLDLPSVHKSVQLWPHRHGTDAMFIALLQRRLEL